MFSAVFHAAFARFIGRRGLSQKVVSVNAINFLGASKELLRKLSSIIKKTYQNISQRNITHVFDWNLILPHAPHIGGLWEAAVKSINSLESNLSLFNSN